MDFATYQKDVVGRTGKMNQGIEAAKALGALGLCGEAAEVLELHLVDSSAELKVKESGDVLWYVGYLCTAYGISLASVAEASERINVGERPEIELVKTAGYLADIIKKELFHARPADAYAVYSWLSVAVCCIRAIAPVGMDQVMLANQAKLLKRFPNGWDTAAAKAKADEAK